MPGKIIHSPLDRTGDTTTWFTIPKQVELVGDKFLRTAKQSVMNLRQLGKLTQSTLKIPFPQFYVLLFLAGQHCPCDNIAFLTWNLSLGHDLINLLLERFILIDKRVNINCCVSLWPYQLTEEGQYQKQELTGEKKIKPSLPSSS